MIRRMLILVLGFGLIQSIRPASAPAQEAAGRGAGTQKEAVPPPHYEDWQAEGIHGAVSAGGRDAGAAWIAGT